MGTVAAEVTYVHAEAEPLPDYQSKNKKFTEVVPVTEAFSNVLQSTQVFNGAVMGLLPFN